MIRHFERIEVSFHEYDRKLCDSSAARVEYGWKVGIGLWLWQWMSCVKHIYVHLQSENVVMWFFEGHGFIIGWSSNMIPGSRTRSSSTTKEDWCFESRSVAWPVDKRENEIIVPSGWRWRFGCYSKTFFFKITKIATLQEAQKVNTHDVRYPWFHFCHSLWKSIKKRSAETCFQIMQLERFGHSVLGRLLGCFA
jgi:hypothetical protein